MWQNEAKVDQEAQLTSRLGQVLEEHRQSLLNYVLSKVRVEQDSVEIVQAVLLDATRAYQRTAKLPDKPLLVKIANDKLADYWRDRSRRYEVSLEENQCASVPANSGETISDLLHPVERLVRIVPEFRFTPAEAGCLEEVFDFDKDGEILDSLSGQRFLFQAGDMTEPKSPQAWRQAKSRARKKARRVFVLSLCLSRSIPPEKFVDYVFKTNIHLKGGPFEPILKRAPILRTDSYFVESMSTYLSRLIDSSFDRLYRAHMYPQNRVVDFVRGYTGLRIVTLLQPEVAEDALTAFRVKSAHVHDQDPLVSAAIKRMEGLTGNPEAIERTRNRWERALREENIWEACYLASYFGPPGLQLQLLEFLSSGDLVRARRFLFKNSAQLRQAVLKEAYENLSEEWYLRNPDWAATNYLRVKLVLKNTEGRCKDLCPSDIKKLRAVGLNAINVTKNARLKQDIWGTIGGSR